MQDFAENVVEFNKVVLHIPKPEHGNMSDKDMEHRALCLREEVDECVAAHTVGDYIGTIDALIDLMYFAIGGLHKLGLTPDEMAECGRIIHRANMLKKLGVVERRDCGVPDAIKPSTWVSPEEQIRRYLNYE